MGNQEGPLFVFTGGPPPNWLEKHSWYEPITVVPAEKMPLVGLRKMELKVDMCCLKCAEIVSEEIREVPGVLNVVVDYVIKKVTVIGKPYEPDVLRRARRVDKKADYWPPPPPPPPPAPEPACCGCVCHAPPPAPKEEPKEEPKKEEPKKEEPKEEKKEKEEEKKEEKKEEEKKEEKKEEEKKEEKKEEEKEEKKEEEKKEEKKEEEKKEEPAPAPAPAPAPTPEAQASIYPPYEFMVSHFPIYDYHPSQSYNPLLPHHPFPQSHQVYFDWPHFRTAESGYEAAFAPSPKTAQYQSVGDFFSIFQPP